MRNILRRKKPVHVFPTGMRRVWNPGKKYRLSFYVKGELTKNSVMDARIWGGKTRIVPEGRLTGSFPWMKVSREFVALGDGKIGLGFNLYGGGKIYFDHVILQKIDD